MALNFAGIAIDGTHGPVVAPTAKAFVKETHFAGLNGVTEINMGSGARMLTVDVVLHKSYAREGDLAAAVKKLTDLQEEQKVGILQVTGTIAAKYRNCRLESLEPIPLGSQDAPGMLYDAAGTLEGNGDPGWWIKVRLIFKQLVVQ